MQEEVEKGHAAQQDRRPQDGVRLLDAHVCRDHVMSENAAAIRMVRGFFVVVTMRIVLSGSRSGSDQVGYGCHTAAGHHVIFYSVFGLSMYRSHLKKAADCT